MTETKWTPGPWTFDGPKNNIIVWSSPVDRVCFLTSNGPTEANASLIAAAPTMAGQLESANVDLNLLLRAIKSGDPTEELRVRVEDIIRRNDAALAKARGESND